MRPCKVLIIDDHAMFGESLALLLSTKGGIDVVGVAKSGEEALDRLKVTSPDIVLVDIEMKDMDGIEAIRAGAKGYVLKNFSSSFILEAIRTVQNGEHAFDPKSSAEAIKAATKILEHDNARQRALLTIQEVRILKLISDGYVNKEISRELGISIHTVRNHIANLFSKLNCSTRTKAVKEAQRQKLI